MKIKEKPSRILFLIIDVIVLLLITYACLMPIWHMVMASISNPTSLNTHPGIVYFPLKSSTARIPSAMKSSAQPKTG